MNLEQFELWIYLSSSPLLYIAITLFVYLVSQKIYNASSKNPLFNPVLLSVSAIICLLLFFKTPYEKYFEGARFIHFLLGPAIVGMAVPLFVNWRRLRSLMIPLIFSLVLGVTISLLSSILFINLLGGDLITALSLAPKAVTTPVAMGISEKIGGLPTLTAALVVIAGIVTAVVSSPVFSLLRIREQSIKGLVLGLNGHAIGTSKAAQIGKEAAAFSGFAMIVSAILNTYLIPLLIPLLNV